MFMTMLLNQDQDLDLDDEDEDDHGAEQQDVGSGAETALLLLQSEVGCHFSCGGCQWNSHSPVFQHT